jgi:SNF2 family DNA or RNA helicase
MRTGKTAAVLWAYEYLRRKGLVNRLLVVCPLSVMTVWEEEAFNVLPHRSFCKLTGTKQRRLDLLSKGSDICVINHDGVTTIQPELKAAGFQLVVDDEATAHRNAQTKRYRLFRELVKSTPWLWLMTGTPVTKSPTDSYALIKLISPTMFPGGFTLFKEMTMTRVGNFKWVPKADAKETVYKYMQPAIRFKKSECMELPPLSYVNRTCELTDEQAKAFDLMRKKLIMEKQDGEKITAANAAVRLLKLLQICCGVVKDNNGEYHILDASTRLNALEECIEEAGGKIIVFAPWKGVMDSIVSFVKSKGYSVGLVNGDVSLNARNKIFTEFKQNGLEILVAHPQTAAHGLDLSSSSTIVWFGPIFSSDQYMQANERISGVKQKNDMTIVHLYSKPIEAAVFRALWQQQMMQATILEQYERILQ